MPEWTLEKDKELRALVEKYGAQSKWATIAIEANFGPGFDSEACIDRWNSMVNPKLDIFHFSPGGACEAERQHNQRIQFKPGHM